MIRSRYDLEIRNIDVGQGDCALISGKDIPAVMIDGGSSDIKEVAKNRIMPVLKANRIPYVRYCFLTHMDSDHVCAVIEMLENGTSGVRIGNIVLSDASLSEAEACDNLTKLLTAAKKRGTGIITMSAGDMIRLGDMKITCLSPGKGGVLSAVKGAGTDANENSLVLRVEFQSFSAMFTGDIGEGTERSIRRAVSDCDYLKVAHHGSRNSTSDDFLALASPEISVISAGVDNSYGHPHKETLSRLAGSGTRIYITAQSGETITVIDDGRVSVSTMLGDK
ncbi:MAG: hypothetical protein J5574_04870 [Lachnospiraceae bacterium]|nr:hypothetical protein [Lachnospiraceae bacterium]